MGANSSTNISDVANTTSNVVLSSTQQCMTDPSLSNVANISGSGNYLSNIKQSTVSTYDSNCQMFAGQDASFVNNMATNLASQASQTTQQFTGFLDNSSNNNAQNIETNLTSNLSVSNVSSCMNQLTAANLLNVSGNQNTLLNLDQNISSDIIASCLTQNPQTASAQNSMSATANLQSTSTVENLFQPFVDMFNAFGNNITLLIVLIIVIIVGIIGTVIIIKKLKHRHTAATK